jgi:hypothetical protein
MFTHFRTHEIENKHRHEELERRAAKHRLVREALAGRRSFHLRSPLLASLGTRLIHLGTSMQQRFGSEEQRYAAPSFRGA